LAYHAGDAVVHAAEGFGVAFVLTLDVEIALIGEVYAVPAVTLVT